MMLEALLCEAGRSIKNLGETSWHLTVPVTVFYENNVYGSCGWKVQNRENVFCVLASWRGV